MISLEIVVNENQTNGLLGVGIYSIPLASLLTGVSSWRIRRWVRGYRFATSSGQHDKPPVWRSDIPPIDGSYALSFQDLIEIRFVDAFLRQGVKWLEIRQAAIRGREMFKTGHPFATNRFRADGRELFARSGEGRSAGLVHISKSQAVFADIVGPYLKGVEFAEDGSTARWWPLERSRRVVIDPARAFGKPIVAREGVPTRVLGAAVASGQSLVDVARWYRVPLASARDAVHYEEQLRVA
jgi:uncharacterized protein (DUF433 family)